MVVPLAAVLTALFNLVINLGAVAVFVLAVGVRPHWTWFLFPLVVRRWRPWRSAPRCCSRRSTSASATWPIWEVTLQLLFYGSPILYVIEVIPSADAREAAHVQSDGHPCSSRAATG